MKIRVYISYAFSFRQATRADEPIVLRPSEHFATDPVLDLETVLIGLH